LAIVVVSSTNPGEGKTGVAAAIARHYAYQGRPVRLIRTGSSPAAMRDAAWFGTLDFAPGAHEMPVAAETVADDPDAILVVEADGEDAAAIEGQHVTVMRGEGAAKGSPVATIRTALRCAPKTATDATPPVIDLAEDRTLAGFSFEEVREALHAQTLVEGDADRPTCDYLVVAPIASDAGQPYFRRFDTKAVVVRFDRTDMHLAAMQADPSFLILTGGRQPSGYLFDAAEAKGIPVLLSATDTENTVMALEDIYERTRFHGERKLDRMAALLEDTPLYSALSI
jgi:BioD-like phosphotransacetylase family protein